MNAEIISPFRTKMIGQILLEWREITEEQLDRALRYQGKRNGWVQVDRGVTTDAKKRIGEILIEMGIITNERIEAALAVQKSYLPLQAGNVSSTTPRSIYLVTYGLATITFASIIFLFSVTHVNFIFTSGWVRYPAHTFTYSILFFLVYITLIYSPWREGLGGKVRSAFLGAFVYGFFIELIRYFIPHGSFSPLDISFDFLGAFSAALIVTYKNWGIAEVNFFPIVEVEEEVRAKHAALGRSLNEIPFKRAFDFTLSFWGSLFSLPIWLLLIFLIWIEDPGPVFFIKRCVGKDGKSFGQIKFRSMVNGAESKTGPILARNNDCRFLRIGSILRKTALDELPQLLNILKGDMSFVGPRPQRTILVHGYLGEIPDYALRHKVKPGLTGIAQVFGHYYVTPSQKLRFDLIYLRRRGFWFDLRLFLYSLMISLIGGWQNKRGSVRKRKLV
jgi:lipopolysaccharide/colanic/teichoic acid biosynthesis glycosyltransferase